MNKPKPKIVKVSKRDKAIKAMAGNVLRSLVNLPFNEGYLKALVDYGHIDKVSFDEFMSIVRR